MYKQKQKPITNQSEDVNKIFKYWGVFDQDVKLRKSVKPVLKRCFQLSSLSTAGAIITLVMTGAAAMSPLGMGLIAGIVLGGFSSFCFGDSYLRARTDQQLAKEYNKSVQIGETVKQKISSGQTLKAPTAVLKTIQKMEKQLASIFNQKSNEAVIHDTSALIKKHVKVLTDTGLVNVLGSEKSEELQIVSYKENVRQRRSQTTISSSAAAC